MLDTPTPTLDALSLATQSADPDGFAQAFGASFQRFGFGVIQDHGIDAGLIDRAWALTKAFFDLPTEVKAKYHIPGKAGARGYTPFGIETAKGATENDLKEFWHVGRELPAGHRYGDVMPPNVWPEEVPGFRETFLALYAEFDRAGAKLLSAIARYLGLDADWFVTPVRDGNSVMRLLHYPPVSPEAPGVRAGAHEDINLITLLLGAEEAGLQLLDRDGRWLSVSPPEGAMVVNVGDMLQRLTNHVLPSTTHRVVNPAPERRGHSRYSMPFFLHPAPDFVIETLPGCITADNPNRYPEPLSSQEYLNRRLRTLGLLKDGGTAG
ncbi:isopenicillin N synthase family oxygenase [Sphingomonas sp. ID1715]|uniref:isopenicillin N synthase family dioxygenase n=1 Tax=Sphingomonas sp. ID1715 TaxID=1656898 RepID=UPI001488E840|nr:isopenicillin N synthase family oxygenase [Sphingomonas sp. ID1715]NNM78176.1 isopenicillin N synthase family oxygenase [Sphingomonas sp. ID1715]